MSADPLQIISLLAFLSALEAHRVSLASGPTSTISWPFNSSSCGPSKTSPPTSNLSFDDHRGFVAPDYRSSSVDGSSVKTTATPFAAPFPLIYQLFLAFSDQFTTISREISTLCHSVVSLQSSLSAVEDRVTSLAAAHESTLARLKDEQFEPHHKEQCGAEALGHQLHDLSSVITAQQCQTSALRDMVLALQADTVHIATANQVLNKNVSRTHKEFDASQNCLRNQFATQPQHHNNCEKDLAVLRQDLQKLSDLVSINDTKTNKSLCHLRNQIVDQVKDQNRTEKDVALLRAKLSKKLGAVQSRISSLALDAVKLPHDPLTIGQAAKEARREKIMAGVGRRIMKLQGSPPHVLDNEDIALQKTENVNVVAISSSRSSPVVLSPVTSSRPSAKCFQAPSCVQRVRTIGPSRIKPPSSRRYANRKEYVNDIVSPSVGGGAESSIPKKRKMDCTLTTPFQPKDCNRTLSLIPMVSPLPTLEAIRRGEFSMLTAVKSANSEHHNKSIYVSPIRCARPRHRI